ncbi:MAG: hypothetical protein JO030_08035, partial [Candidatus Eremiobacteraeota bacterium]|nr:hypothetical protein [Candidatus Eremiobacteraeota bacterium]
LFIAQPPLYKVTRGKSEQYLKDERALEDYLIAAGLEDAVEAEQIFTDLMGDKVEPRKQYIFDYAKSVTNLDL